MRSKKLVLSELCYVILRNKVTSRYVTLKLRYVKSRLRRNERKRGKMMTDFWGERQSSFQQPAYQNSPIPPNTVQFCLLNILNAAAYRHARLMKC